MVIMKYLSIIDESKWYQKHSLFLILISYSIRNNLQITEERKRREIDLYFNQHKSYAEIAK
jgi:hypothetical protein